VLWKGKKVVKICLLLYDTKNVNMYSFVCYQGDLQLPSTEEMWKDIYQTRDKLIFLLDGKSYQYGFQQLFSHLVTTN